MFLGETRIFHNGVYCVLKKKLGDNPEMTKLVFKKYLENLKKKQNPNDMITLDTNLHVNP